MTSGKNSLLWVSVILFFLALVSGMADLPMSASVYAYILIRSISIITGTGSIFVLIMAWKKSNQFYRIFLCLLFVVNVLNIMLTFLNLSSDFAI